MQETLRDLQEHSMFKPENDLEHVMQAAAGDPTKIPDFYKVLLESEIYILTPDAKMEPGRRRSLKYLEPLNVATVAYQGLRWHPAFTSKNRISAYVKEPETCFGAVAKNMFPDAARLELLVQPALRVPETHAGQRNSAAAFRRHLRDAGAVMQVAASAISPIVSRPFSSNASRDTSTRVRFSSAQIHTPQKAAPRLAPRSVSR